MMWHDWGLPLLVLSLGLVVGLVMAVRSRGGLGSESRARVLAVLRSHKETLVNRLAALEERADRGTPEWLEEVEPLREEAANCLRDMEALDPTADSVVTRAASTRRTHLRWTLGSLLVLVGSVGLMIYLVRGSTTERVRPSGELFAEAQEILETNPNDLDANNRVSYWNLNQLAIPMLRGVLTMEGLTSFAAQEELGTRLQLVASMEVESPQHVLNSAIASTLVASLGESDQFVVAGQALGSLQAGDIDPSVLALWRAFYRYAQGERELGITALESIEVDSLDEIESRVHTLLRAKLEARVMARVRVIDGVGRVGGGDGLLYITIRDTEIGGMPFAGKRVGADSLSQTIEIDEQDLLPMRQGEPWPETYWVHAYYDADGVVEIGQAEQDPNNVFAEPIGPFSVDDPVELQQIVLTRVATAALFSLPSLSDVVEAEAPWLNWDFPVFDVVDEESNGTLGSRAGLAMNTGNLSEALGLLTILGERRGNGGGDSLELWMYGAILQGLAGEQALAQGRMELLLDEAEAPVHAWIWAALLAAERGDSTGWEAGLLGAEERGANNDWAGFFDYVSGLDPVVVPVPDSEPNAVSRTMRATVSLDDGLDTEGLEGDVWVVVRAPDESGNETQMIAFSTVAIDTLPATVDDWQNTPPDAWPPYVWVDAYVAAGAAGWEQAAARSAREGPVRRSDSVELMIESRPPPAPPGHP